MRDRVDCENVKGLLADFATENLRKGEAGRVRKHLASCEECRRKMQAYEAVATLVEESGLLEPPAGLWNGVLNRITDPERAPSVTRPGFGRRLRLGAAALAMALLLWIGFASQRRTSAPASVANAVAAEYLEGHAVGSRDALFADRFSLASVAALAEAEQRKDGRL